MQMTVLAQGGLQRIKEMIAVLERKGVEAKVLAPADGCVTG